MTAKEYLQQIRRLENDIKRFEEHIREYEDLMLSSSSPNTDNNSGKGAAGRTEGSSLENRVVKFTEKIQKLQKLKEKKVKLKTRIELQVMSLNNAQHAEILQYRYIDCLSWKDVAHIMNYSENWVKHIHGDALRAFYKKYYKILNKNVDKSPDE